MSFSNLNFVSTTTTSTSTILVSTTTMSTTNTISASINQNPTVNVNTTNPISRTAGRGRGRGRGRDGRANQNPVTWNEQQIRLLINQRKNRNIEYHQTPGRSRVAFWDSVARRINRSAGSNFMGIQCRRKFENLVSSYNVSKYDKLY